MNTKPRILFVDNALRSFVSSWIPLARAARNAGFEVHVASPAGDTADQLSAEGFLFHAIPLSRSSVNPAREVVAIAALFRVYRRIQPDLIHHLRLKPVLYGTLAARLAGVPAVVNVLTGLGYLFTGNGRSVRFLRPLVMLACRVAFWHPNQRLVFQNPDDCAIFLRSGILPVEKTLLIKGSGVDTDRFSPRPEPPGPPVVMLASRMLWDKGVKEFVQAARTLRAAGFKARFVLVGDTDPGNPSAIPTERLRKWNERGFVEWWGPRSDMPEVLGQAHIVCLPSIREGLPRILIEAAACGRALVTTDVPGCREVVRNGDNGLLVPIRHASSLVWAFRLLLENADLRQSMGARSRERALREFNRDLVVGQMLSLYGLMLGSRSSTTPTEAPMSNFSVITPLSVSQQSARDQ
jgi:glycosyltransferase involved in cell wall biosynthesis